MKIDQLERGERWRAVASRCLVSLGGLCLLVALVGAWAQSTLLDSRTFADRTTTLLQSPATREHLAQSLTDQIIATGRGELTSYRPLLLVAVDATLGTEAFQSIFRQAVRDAHQRGLGMDVERGFALNLAATVEVLRELVAGTNPELAEAIPVAPTAFLLDVTDQVRALTLDGRLKSVDVVWKVAAALVAASYAAALAIAPMRREVFTWMGFGWVATGAAIVLTTVVLPGLVAGRIDDASLASTAEVLASRFVGDLEAIGYWVIGYGTLLVALANARQHIDESTTLRRTVERIWAFATRRPSTSGAQVGRAVALVAAGFLIVRWARPAAVLAIAVAGLVVAYFGLVELVRIVGQGAPPPEPLRAVAGGATRARRRVGVRRTWVAVAAVAVIGLLALSSGAALTVGDARARAAVEQRCNGSEELCDRRVDEVVMAGTHNSMSALREPGWLFAVHNGGIGAQLQAGVRALLLDTHYGVPSTLPSPGTTIPLVVTDRAASRAAGMPNPSAAGDSEMGTEEAEQALDLAGTAPLAPGAVPEPYLCHTWCELGATKLVDGLASIRNFLEGHPDEVIIVIFEDYVSPTDTATAFSRAGLLDRVWVQEPDEPLPTLREMVDARRNLLVVSQHGGPPPTWYNPFETLIQDTPFGFASIEDMSCAPNRGDAEAPLLLVNHWLNTGASTPVNGRAANAYDVLTARVDECVDVRERRPNIVAVDWFSIGDLVSFVADLNAST